MHGLEPETRYTVDPVTGELVDPETGEVIESHPIAMGPEWRAYTAHEWMQRSRAGSIRMFSVHDSGLHTRIDVAPAIVEARKFNRTSLAAKAIKLRKLNREVREDKSDRKLVTLLSLIWNICRHYNLGDEVIETAGQIARKLLKAANISWVDMEEAALACMIAACRVHGVPIIARRIMRERGADRRKVWNLLITIHTRLNIKPRIADPRQYMPGFCERLGLSARVQMLASTIIDAMKRRGMTDGKDPAGLAAAAIYVASILLNEKRTQDEIANATGVTTVTIRNRYRDIVEKLTIEVML